MKILNSLFETVSEKLSKAHWNALILLFVWLLASVYVGVSLKKGWDPIDEGTLGQSAERVLHGEMPHRDFDDPYTGGLAYIDAAIFKLFGINLFWLRLFLFVCFLVWVPAVYGLAREFLPPWPAGAVTLIAVAWSVPNYTAAMPSWFNLFFATFGTLALAKYIRTPAIRWLLLAGLCGGCSFLIKSVALYYIAGGLLFFVFREQSLSRNQPANPRRTLVYLAFLTLCLSLFVFALIKLVLVIGGMPEFLHFVFPGVAIAILLAYRERIAPTVSEVSRFRLLFSMVVPFLLGAILPVGLFCLFYWRHHALLALLTGLFVAPFRRLLSARMPPIDLVFEYPSVLAALLIAEAAKLRGRLRQVLSVSLVALATAVLVGSLSNDLAYIVSLTSALGIIPVLVVAAMPVLSAKRSLQKSNLNDDQLLALLLTMTALFSLIQFPYSSPGYFWYVSPLAICLAAALISRLASPPRVILYATTAFYLLFPVFVMGPHFMGGHKRPDPNDTVLALPRAGGLRIPKQSAAQYLDMIRFVRNIAGDNQIFAGPNCPEVYFLAGAKNPTPMLFDSLQDARTYPSDMQTLFDRPNFVKLAVIEDLPNSSDHLHILRSLVVTRFPNSRKIGSFTVYWRR